MDISLNAIKRSNSTLSSALAAMLLGGCCLGLVSLYFSAGEYGLRLCLFYLTQPLVLILNLLPFVLVCVFFFCVTNRAWAGFTAGAIMCALYSWAEYWKLMARNDPIFAEDLTLLSEAAQIGGQYIRLTWQILLSAVFFVACAVFLYRKRSGRFSTIAPRLAIPTLIVLLCCWLYPNVYTSSRVYNAMGVSPSLNQWFETNRYISRGGIYPFLYSIPSAVPTAPEGYDATEAQTLLASYATDSIAPEEQVSVIMVMYEAFSDLTPYTDRITGADPYEAFHDLQSESYSGTLITNIFAGGTINTERCVLTGFNSLTNFRRSGWSYARYFAQQGYTINGAHAGFEAFYNRRNVNRNLGISDYRFIEGYYEDLFSGSIPTDAQLLPDIARYCKQQMANGPVFSFNVTYQNHGPYSSDACRFTQEYVPQADLSDSDYRIVNNYLEGVRDTGIRMMEMVDSFRDTEEPVILVFFGDHKPWLGEQSVTYRALGIDIFSQDDSSFYTYYSTEYLIWANDAAKAVLGNDFTGLGPTISPCYLMNVLFDQCGWEGPGFLKLSNQVMSRLPVVHATNRYQEDGILVGEAELSEEDAALLYALRIAQYYLAQDSGGEHPQ